MKKTAASFCVKIKTLRYTEYTKKEKQNYRIYTNTVLQFPEKSSKTLVE